MVTCSIIAEHPLRSVCMPISTPRSVEDATNVERLIMGIFVSSALFELSEWFGSLPCRSSTNELHAAAIIVTVHHSMRLRSTGIRTASELSSTLWKGSLLYALSLLGMSFGYLWPLSSSLTVLQAISIANIVTLLLPVRSFHFKFTPPDRYGMNYYYCSSQADRMAY